MWFMDMEKRFLSSIAALSAFLLLCFVSAHASRFDCNSSKSKWERLPRASEVLGEKDDNLRAENVVCLDSFQEDAIPILIKALSDRKWEIRALAIRMLIPFGEKAKKAIPSLIKDFDDPQESIRREIVDGILGVDPKGESIKKTLPVFRKALKDSDSEVRRRARQNLAALEKYRPEVVKEFAPSR